MGLFVTTFIFLWASSSIAFSQVIFARNQYDQEDYFKIRNNNDKLIRNINININNNNNNNNNINVTLIPSPVTIPSTPTTSNISESEVEVREDEFLDVTETEVAADSDLIDDDEIIEIGGEDEFNERAKRFSFWRGVIRIGGRGRTAASGATRATARQAGRQSARSAVARRATARMAAARAKAQTNLGSISPEPLLASASSSRQAWTSWNNRASARGGAAGMSTNTNNLGGSRSISGSTGSLSNRASAPGGAAGMSTNANNLGASRSISGSKESFPIWQPQNSVIKRFGGKVKKMAGTAVKTIAGGVLFGSGMEAGRFAIERLFAKIEGIPEYDFNDTATNAIYKKEYEKFEKEYERLVEKENNYTVELEQNRTEILQSLERDIEAWNVVFNETKERQQIKEDNLLALEIEVENQKHNFERQKKIYELNTKYGIFKDDNEKINLKFNLLKQEHEESIRLKTEHSQLHDRDRDDEPRSVTSGASSINENILSQLFSTVLNWPWSRASISHPSEHVTVAKMVLHLTDVEKVEIGKAIEAAQTELRFIKEAGGKVGIEIGFECHNNDHD